MHTQTTSLTDFLSPLIPSIVTSSVCICACTNVCTHVHARTTVRVWVKEDIRLEAVLSFQHVGPKNGIQVLRLGGKYVNLPNRLSGHLFSIFVRYLLMLWPEYSVLLAPQNNHFITYYNIKETGNVQTFLSQRT